MSIVSGETICGNFNNGNFQKMFQKHTRNILEINARNKRQAPEYRHTIRGAQLSQFNDGNFQKMKSI
jgi:hypothetical protein